ncbi:MAG: 30S ribosomal protein S12 methylthiotransferase RimO [Gammaproteobacteria bacterium]|nr:30S ribosomal protein S12 methylthiotransferase RimO [Gammaproteobacteria bacterium]
MRTPSSTISTRQPAPDPRVGFVSLGCPKALVDSERILTQLRSEGYRIAPDYAGADLVVVNTCGFIDSAIEESLDAIGEAIKENGKVIVTGCLGANPQKILEQHPQVLRVTGPHAYDDVLTAVHEYLPPRHDPFLDLVPEQGVRLTPSHYAYLKISEGCNNRCSFCIIPDLRGRLVSRRLDDVLREAERLARAGVKELLVISQDTSAYGSDLRYPEIHWQGETFETRFVDLSRALGTLGIWVRMHYVYPYPHVDAVLPLMAEGKILPYLDIPFQHASPSVLKRMRRPAHAENTLRRIEAWRAICPDLTLRSTFIVGFPGETDAEFEQLLQWLKSAQIDRVGAFMYSPVEGAKANALAEHIPVSVQQERLDTFMQIAQEISAQRLNQKVGSIQTLLIDSVMEDPDQSGEILAIGRTRGDAPEVDGIVEVRGNLDAIRSGSFVEARIVAANDYDLEAVIE